MCSYVSVKTLTVFGTFTVFKNSTGGNVKKKSGTTLPLLEKNKICFKMYTEPSTVVVYRVPVLHVHVTKVSHYYLCSCTHYSFVHHTVGSCRHESIISMQNPYITTLHFFSTSSLLLGVLLFLLFLFFFLFFFGVVSFAPTDPKQTSTAECAACTHPSNDDS